jgi:hypothetical protein
VAANCLEQRDGIHVARAKKNVGELPHIVTRPRLEIPLQRGKYRDGAGFRQFRGDDDGGPEATRTRPHSGSPSADATRVLAAA